MNATATRTLISADELAAWLARTPQPVVVDTSFDLADTDAGERRYRESHLPGAHYLHLDRDLSGTKTGRNGRHPLPERSAFRCGVGALGIAPGTQVVCYDAQGGVYAARLWWMLRWLGHAEASVLDGGIQAWKAAGKPLTSAPAAAAGGPPYPERPSLVATVDAAGVATRRPESQTRFVATNIHAQSSALATRIRRLPKGPVPGGYFAVRGPMRRYLVLTAFVCSSGDSSADK